MLYILNVTAGELLSVWLERDYRVTRSAADYNLISTLRDSTV